ncbi:hypothetical protein [Microbacterium sp. MRS-1]|uniref:hypothetical protein n=1 Tax=Microbacterium sp. MRS-1 TaxID=1451261 RepID=UPI0004457FA4|nr:hypothetical protein [Microbacterium sp. MRS-1]EXJ50761.1 hypothetical protein AS96_13050 [Microbacterium sp. MRS-1]
MTIDIRGTRLSLERHLSEFVKAGGVRSLGAESYQVAGGRVRVRLTEERRFEIIVSFTALRTSSRLFVRDIELDYQAAVTAEVVRFLLAVGIGVEFSVTTAAFFGAVVTVDALPQTPAAAAAHTFEWR